MTSKLKFLWLSLAVLLLGVVGCGLLPQQTVEPAAPIDEISSGAASRDRTDAPSISQVNDSAETADADETIEEEAVDLEIPVPPPPIEEMARVEAAVADGAYYGGSPSFRDRDVRFDVAFPDEPATAVVFRVQDPYSEQQSMDQDAFRAIGEQLGFGGAVYAEAYPGMPSRPTISDGPLFMIDGTRRLNLYGSSLHYENYVPGKAQQFGGLSGTELVRIGTEFAQGFGLDMSQYDARANGSDVNFFPLVDGNRINMPVLTVSIDNEGEVTWANYMPFGEMSQLDEAQLISAETAWNNMLNSEERGPEEEFVYFEIYPTDEQRRTMYGYHGEPFGNWNRAQSTNSTVTLNTWPQIFVDVDSDEKVIFVDGMRLLGDQAELDAISSQQVEGLLITGTILEATADSVKSFQLESWEAMKQPSEFNLSGEIEREGETVYLRVAGGQRFRIPDAPAEIEGGNFIFVYGWAIRDEGTGVPVIEWQQINLFDMGYMEEPMIEEIYIDPYNFEAATVTDINVSYQQSYSGNRSVPADYWLNGPDIALVPMWRFSGTVDNGATFDLWLPALQLEQ